MVSVRMHVSCNKLTQALEHCVDLTQKEDREGHSYFCHVGKGPVIICIMLQLAMVTLEERYQQHCTIAIANTGLGELVRPWPEQYGLHAIIELPIILCFAVYH